MADLTRVFSSQAPDAAIRGFITAFAGFWAADRAVMRRLRALAALDPDVGPALPWSAAGTSPSTANQAGTPPP